MAYSDYEKQLAIELVHRNKDVLDATCLAEIRAALNSPTLPARSVYNWIKKGISSVKRENFTEKISLEEYVSFTLDRKFEEAAHRFLNHAVQDKTIKKMSGSAAILSAATAVDKMRLLRGLPTQIVAILPKLVEAMEDQGIDATEAFQKLYEQVKARQVKVQHVDAS